MVKKSLLLCLILITLNLGVMVYGDVILTVESDKAAYELGENATFTATLKNMSQQDYFYVIGDVEYRFSVSRDGDEVRRLSEFDCG
jgi:hypothetical protein